MKPESRPLTKPAYPEDERALRALVAQCETAWNASDSGAFANTMAENVAFVGLLGERYEGREIVALGHRHIFDTIYKDSRVRYTIELVRFLKPDVATWPPTSSPPPPASAKCRPTCTRAKPAPP
jgi:uncharacterized protein (TIGR02246 family)